MNIKSGGSSTRAGKNFQYSTVARLLANPTLKGEYRFSQAEKGTNRRVQHESSVEAIIDPELWDQVRVILTGQAGVQSRKPAQDIFIGKVYCDCENTMEILSKTSAYWCHTCKTQIATDDIHAIFEHGISDIAFPDLRKYNNQKNLKSEIEKRIRESEKRIEKLFELHSCDAITAEVFKDRHCAQYAQLQELKKKLADRTELPSLSYHTLLEYWKSINDHTKQLIIDTVVEPRLCNRIFKRRT